MNGANSHRRLEEILIAAMETPREKLDDYLREACGQNAELRDRVRKMVEQEVASRQSTETTNSGRESSVPPRQVGPYVLHSPIGSGSFGIVYLASRADELRRRVAIKFLKPWMDPAQFRAETQYLALLNHPNIVKVFDFGKAAEGDFYCVMEYVEGQDLTTSCRARRLGLAGRLNLFRTICSAVQAAHRVPLVHRDLKPDNIRVTTEGDPKVLDWGLARLLQQDLALHVKAPSVPGLVAGTWVYASPEQLRGGPVTTATDIYSLGVILYEMFTGTVPFVREGMTLSDFTKAVVEQAPPPPSSVIAGDAAIANEMGCSGRALANLLRGELDAIVLMAIRKEPERRYASVEALAADVSAYLTGFPVAARPDSLAYRARKLMGRHRALAAMSCLAFLSLSGGLAVSLSLERKEAAARVAAQDSQHRMQLESAALGQALNELVQKEVPTLPQLTQAEEARAQVDRSPSDSAAKASLAAALQQLFEADAKARDFQSAANHCKQAEELAGGDSLRERCDYYDGKAQLKAPSGGLGAFDIGTTAPKSLRCPHRGAQLPCAG
jgi:eukaryotic-like serine/threonine-protein kinase